MTSAITAKAKAEKRPSELGIQLRRRQEPLFTIIRGKLQRSRCVFTLGVFITARRAVRSNLSQSRTRPLSAPFFLPYLATGLAYTCAHDFFFLSSASLANPFPASFVSDSCLGLFFFFFFSSFARELDNPPCWLVY